MPDTIPAPTDPKLGMNGKWTTRPIAGAMGSLGPRRLWMSEVRDLVEGFIEKLFFSAWLLAAVHVATDLHITARTDARAAVGMDEALERAKMARDTGVDALALALIDRKSVV